MAYEVTATRRRPRRFEDMIGQDFVVATLQKSIEAGKIAPAYLFSGPRGCGKTSSARILAKSLNCASGPTGTPCGECPACAEIARGASLDVIEIDGASNTSVNDVRQIKDEVLFPPNSCRYKVYIIDEVHMLSTSAFNALLKTIEEPPPYVIFIFATTELHKVPATIKSRCQQFNFRLVPVELLKESLAQAAAELGIEAEDEALYWIAREATGSVRDAYTLFDQVAAFSDGHISFDKIRDKLGLVGVDRINPLVELCVDGKGGEALLLLDGILQGGVSVEQFTTDLAEYFRSLLFVKSGVRQEALLGQRPERYSSRVLEAWSAVQLERALSLALQLFRDLRYSIDPRFELELAVSRLSWLADYVSPPELKKAIADARKALGGGDSRPFPAADRRDEPSPAARQKQEIPAVRGEESPAFVNASPDTEPAGDDAPVSDPFAALKARMGMGRPLAVPPAPAPEPVSTAASASASVPGIGRDAAPDEVPAPASTSPKPSFADPEPALPDSPQEPGDSPLDPAVPGIPFAELQDSLVAAFQSTKNMVATGIRQGFDWTDCGQTVRFSVDKPFTRNYLEQERKALSAEASRLLGRRVELEIVVDAAARAEDAGDGEVPPGVELVRQMFRGTIL